MNPRGVSASSALASKATRLAHHQGRRQPLAVSFLGDPQAASAGAPTQLLEPTISTWSRRPRSPSRSPGQRPILTTAMKSVARSWGCRRLRMAPKRWSSLLLLRSVTCGSFNLRSLSKSVEHLRLILEFISSIVSLILHFSAHICREDSVDWGTWRRDGVVRGKRKREPEGSPKCYDRSEVRTSDFRPR